MSFNSIAFAIFLPIVFLIYWFVVNRNLKAQNIFLLIASYFFYSWWDWRFLSLLISISILNYCIGIRIYKSEIGKGGKFWLIIGLISNIGVLCIFKYYNFFIDSFIDLVSLIGYNLSKSTTQIILPLGISFYVFLSLSYIIDIYRKNFIPNRSIVEVLLTLGFFPIILAGPIQRPSSLLPQISKTREFNYNYAVSGIRLILFGLFKKMVIADNAAILVNNIYNNPSSFVGFPMVVATIFFAFQIYCDFSGYSDIAVGIARIFGFELMNNFDKPYFSSSLTEFWKRWHISLTTWFRDYLFLPTAFAITWTIKSEKILLLKADTFIYILASVITWLLIGLWHGANYTFLIWGGIQGLVITLEHIFKKIKLKTSFLLVRKLKTIFAIIFSFLIVCFGWIFFRANTVSDAIFIIEKMFSDIKDYSDLLILSTKFRGLGMSSLNFIMTILFILFMLSKEYLEIRGVLEKVFNQKRIVRWIFDYSLLFFIIFWGTENPAANFIYFQF
jgi:D-alanyl-lipoteichoic acid acyltransferase DltB (MBOAT superfamily)